MRRVGRMVCLSLVALGLVGCGNAIAPASDDASAKSAAVAPVGKPCGPHAQPVTTPTADAFGPHLPIRPSLPLT